MLLLGGLGWALSHSRARAPRSAGEADTGQTNFLASPEHNPAAALSELPRSRTGNKAGTNRLKPSTADVAPGPASDGVVQAGSTNAPLSNEQQVNNLVNEGTRLLGQGKTSQAAELFAEAVKINADDETLHFNLAVAWGLLGRAEAARREYLEALRLFPEYPEAHVNLGNLLAKEGRRSEAMEQFNLALKAAPDSASAHNALGTVLAKEQNYREAVAQFLECIRLQPDYVEAHYNLGVAYLMQGKTDQAIEKFNEIVKQHPDFQPARAGLQRALRKKGGSTPGLGTSP